MHYTTNLCQLIFNRRGSDSLNWREEPSRIADPPASNLILLNTLPHQPHQFSTSSHQYFQSQQQRFIDQDHAEMVRFLNESKKFMNKTAGVCPSTT